jgi:hypothetical protein
MCKINNFSNGTIINYISNNVIGLENKNITNVIGNIKYIICEQNKNEKFVYSIDPYISQNKYEQHIKDNFLVKFGVISTK